MRVLEARLPPGLLTVRACPDSYHVATMDNDAQAIFTGSLQFVREHGYLCRSMVEGGARQGRSGENDEEAAWLDLIAHYDAPAAAGGQPWPERENLAPRAGTPGINPWRFSGHKSPEGPGITGHPGSLSGQGAACAGGPAVQRGSDRPPT